MIISILYIAISLLLFYAGASQLVKGSTSLALKAGISPFVAGMSIVAFGISTPGLIFDINAALSGHSNLAIGNMMGIHLFNIAIILGLAAIIGPLKITSGFLKYTIFFLLAVTLAFIFAFSDRQISRAEGAMLLSGLAFYLTTLIIFDKRNSHARNDGDYSETLGDTAQKWYYSVSVVLLGIGLLIAGAGFLLKGALTLSTFIKAGTTTIGITLAAAATALPAMALTIAAAVRKKNEIALGNVIGLSIFTLLGNTGISALISPLTAIAISNIDLFVMLGASMLLLPFVRKKYILKRDEGIFTIVLYLVYLYYLWPK